MQSLEYDFAERFTAAWQQPTPARLVALLHPDATLYQPHLPPIRGKAVALAEFQRLFAWLPGLYGKVEYIAYRVEIGSATHGRLLFSTLPLDSRPCVALVRPR